MTGGTGLGQRALGLAQRVGMACCDRALDAMDMVVYLLGPLMIVTAVGLVSFCIYIYFWALRPWAFPEWTLHALAHLPISLWICVVIPFNYFCCILTSPGVPAPVTPEQEGQLAPDVRICRKCRAMKPARTHHCSVCNRCVHRMDHHCPWMHNCVGLQNHRYFILFLAYMSIGCIYYAAFAIPYVYERFQSSMLSARDDHVPVHWVIFTVVLALTIFVALASMLAWHLYLISRARTQIEFYSAYGAPADTVNVYDLGAIKNFEFFFSVAPSTPWWYALLPIRVAAATDGFSYPLSKDLEHENLNRP